jgi:hypothetical protein
VVERGEEGAGSSLVLGLKDKDLGQIPQASVEGRVMSSPPSEQRSHHIDITSHTRVWGLRYGGAARRQWQYISIVNGEAIPLSRR